MTRFIVDEEAGTLKIDRTTGVLPEERAQPASSSGAGMLVCQPSETFSTRRLRGTRIDGLVCRDCRCALSADSFSIARIMELLRRYTQWPRIVTLCAQCAGRYADARPAITEDYTGAEPRYYERKTLREIEEKRSAP